MFEGTTSDKKPNWVAPSLKEALRINDGLPTVDIEMFVEILSAPAATILGYDPSNCKTIACASVGASVTAPTTVGVVGASWVSLQQRTLYAALHFDTHSACNARVIIRIRVAIQQAL